MHIENINSNYNKYKYNNSRVNFKGKFINGTPEKFGLYVENVVNNSFSGRKSVITATEKKDLVKKIADIVAANIEFIKTKQSPLVELGFESLDFEYYDDEVVHKIYGTSYNPFFYKIEKDEKDKSKFNLYLNGIIGNLYLNSSSNPNLYDINFTNDEERIKRELDFIAKAKSTIKMLKDDECTYIIKEPAESNTEPFSYGSSIFSGTWDQLGIPGIKNSKDLYDLYIKSYKFDINDPEMKYYKDFFDKYIKPITHYATHIFKNDKCEIAMNIYSKLQEALKWFEKNPTFCTEKIAKELKNVIKLYEKTGLLEIYYDLKSREVEIDKSIFEDPKYSKLFV